MEYRKITCSESPATLLTAHFKLLKKIKTDQTEKERKKEMKEQKEQKEREKDKVCINAMMQKPARALRVT